MNIELRPATESDLEGFFTFQLDREASQMAAFTAKDPTDREAYISAWKSRLKNPRIKLYAIEFEGEVSGSVASFDMEGQREVTYWLGRQFWGRGIASAALQQFLELETERPLHGRVAKHNHGSRRVLEKCGFVQVAEEKGFSDYLQREVDEFVYRLD